MDITISDKIKLLFQIYPTIFRQPRKYFFKNLLKPFDAARYIEFAYLLNFIKDNKISNVNILDVSSPQAIDYILSGKNKVLKINVDEREKEYIKEDDNLKFQLGNALNLKFKDNSFDLVISISVIEHIYSDYLKAVGEMIRVCKAGRYIYLTFPVAFEHTEEWSDRIVYSESQKVGDKIFFQYRFSEKDIKNILTLKGMKVIANDIYWEKYNGMYDEMIKRLNSQRFPKLLKLLRIPFIQFYYGLFLFSKSSRDFTRASSCGNTHLILQKNKRT